MNDLLKVTGLCKQYPRFRLSDVSFTLPEGCITGFVGANGAGKTTTLRILLGLAKRDSGSITLLGEEAHALSPSVRDRLGVVLGTGTFYEDLSIRSMKNILAASYTHWQEAEFTAYAERFSLNPSQKIATLSTGMKMKLSLALAFSHQAELLLMDEPTSGLDPLVRRQFLSLLTEFMEKGGRGVFYSTHITSDLERTADNLIFIDHGKILLEENRDTLLDRFHLVKGSCEEFTEEALALLLQSETGVFHITGITDQLEKLRQLVPGIQAQRASIDDVLLALTQKGKA